MNTNKKIYRIFVSSCRRLLEEERQVLSRIILQHGHHPFQMEFNFDGSTEERSLDVDMKKIQQSDSVICILSFLYGEVIGKKIGDIQKCPLYNSRRCANCSCNEHIPECSLSFTEFEYEYSKFLKKKVYVIYNRMYKDQSSFEQAIETKNLDNQESATYRNTFLEYKRDNVRFIEQAITFHAFPYTTPKDFEESCKNAVLAAEHSILESEQKGANDLGLIPYSYLCEANQKVENLKLKLNDLITNGIETVYESQSSAIISLEDAAQKGENIYLGQNGEIQKTRVLAIRGVSFTQSGMGHEEWSKFIISDTYKRRQQIPVEFLLADCRNQKLIEDRYLAFRKQAGTIEEFREVYQKDMETVQSRIEIYKEKHPCSLYLHHETKLPFRMIFIGKYLFLSTFTSTTPASHAPVMKIPSSSSLYKVCEEYYYWIKNREDTIEK